MVLRVRSWRARLDHGPAGLRQLTAELAARFGLEARPWGPVLCQDDAGGLVTLATEDLAWWGTLVGLDAEELAAVELPADRLGLRRAGWPGDWS